MPGWNWNPEMKTPRYSRDDFMLGLDDKPNFVPGFHRRMAIYLG